MRVRSRPWPAWKEITELFRAALEERQDLALELVQSPSEARSPDPDRAAHHRQPPGFAMAVAIAGLPVHLLCFALVARASEEGGSLLIDDVLNKALDALSHELLRGIERVSGFFD